MRTPCKKCSSIYHPTRECSVPDPMVRVCIGCGREPQVYGPKRGRLDFICKKCLAKEAELEAN